MESNCAEYSPDHDWVRPGLRGFVRRDSYRKNSVFIARTYKVAQRLRHSAACWTVGPTLPHTVHAAPSATPRHARLVCVWTLFPFRGLLPRDLDPVRRLPD